MIPDVVGFVYRQCGESRKTLRLPGATKGREPAPPARMMPFMFERFVSKTGRHAHNCNHLSAPERTWKASLCVSRNDDKCFAFFAQSSGRIRFPAQKKWATRENPTTPIVKWLMLKRAGSSSRQRKKHPNSASETRRQCLQTQGSAKTMNSQHQGSKPEYDRWQFH